MFFVFFLPVLLRRTRGGQVYSWPVGVIFHHAPKRSITGSDEVSGTRRRVTMRAGVSCPVVAGVSIPCGIANGSG